MFFLHSFFLLKRKLSDKKVLGDSRLSAIYFHKKNSWFWEPQNYGLSNFYIVEL